MEALLWIGLVILLAIVAFFLRSQYERDQLVTTEYEIASDKLSPEFDGLKIVYLTDLHDKEFGEGNVRLLREVREAKPDMVLIGGDSMVARSGLPISIEKTLSFVRALSGEYPVYYGYGNHEMRLQMREPDRSYKVFAHELRQAGVRILDNRSISFHGSCGSLTITGLTMPWEAFSRYHKKPLQEGLIEHRVGTVQEKDFRILMAHTPLYREEYAAWGADVTLCGHYHGGTIHLPIVGGVMSPDYLLFPGICRGKFETAGKTMIVSGGLGTHSINIRFGNKPQIILLKLRSLDTES